MAAPASTEVPRIEYRGLIPPLCPPGHARKYGMLARSEGFRILELLPKTFRAFLNSHRKFGDNSIVRLRLAVTFLEKERTHYCIELPHSFLNLLHREDVCHQVPEPIE